MPSVLITGAGRGIGLEFARQYAAAGWQVIATVRDAGQTEALQALGARVELLDMEDFSAIAAFPARLGEFELDLFIANAGISGPQRIDTLDAASGWQKVHAVNTVAPTLLAEVLLPRVAAARGKLVAITSQMGSIADSSGGYLAYRASKAALNAAWRALALSLAGQPVTFAMFHPGWVKTDMGGPNATLSMADSVEALRRAIGRLEQADSGGFFNYDGQPLPW
jgi:NAD(P)-dependent dehydrogenase (short-subunit alcohol dehydrogenase family)